jgi:hypothetical protein
VTAEEAATEAAAERLAKWRQGDFALGVGGFLFGETSEAEPYDAHIGDDDVAGLVVISQTCDVVRLSDDRRWVAVSPLVERDADYWSAIANGRYPSLVSLEHPPKEGMFVDLARIMSVAKPLLANWERREGFTTPERAIRFAGAIERKMGRFAFPDDFNDATKSFQERVRKRHNKPQSDLGKIYRSIDQLRFQASPHWDADAVEITLVAVLHPQALREASVEDVAAELRGQCGSTVWPARLGWSDPPLLIGTADDLRGSDILNSQLADLEYLSG